MTNRSTGIYSSLVYDGATIPVTPFVTTIEDGQFIGNETISTGGGGEQKENTNSWLITSGSADLYIIPVLTNEEPSDYTGMHIFHIPAETSKEFTLLNIKGIKILNAAGAEYLLEVFTI